MRSTNSSVVSTGFSFFDLDFAMIGYLHMMVTDGYARRRQTSPAFPSFWARRKTFPTHHTLGG
jgi:hypothetical protein